MSPERARAVHGYELDPWAWLLDDSEAALGVQMLRKLVDVTLRPLDGLQ